MGESADEAAARVVPVACAADAATLPSASTPATEEARPVLASSQHGSNSAPMAAVAASLPLPPPSIGLSASPVTNPGPVGPTLPLREQEQQQQRPAEVGVPSGCTQEAPHLEDGTARAAGAEAPATSAPDGHCSPPLGSTTTTTASLDSASTGGLWPYNHCYHRTNPTKKKSWCGGEMRREMRMLDNPGQTGTCLLHLSTS